MDINGVIVGIIIGAVLYRFFLIFIETFRETKKEPGSGSGSGSIESGSHIHDTVVHNASHFHDTAVHLDKVANSDILKANGSALDSHLAKLMEQSVNAQLKSIRKNIVTTPTSA